MYDFGILTPNAGIIIFLSYSLHILLHSSSIMASILWAELFKLQQAPDCNLDRDVSVDERFHSFARHQGGEYWCNVSGSFLTTSLDVFTLHPCDKLCNSRSDSPNL